MKFKDKVVLITGASRGIGRATALEFAKEGAKIVVDYVEHEDDANKVIEEIKKLGSDAIAIRCDISDETQVQNMVRESIEKFGRIDILVNNAGIVIDVPMMERTVEEWRRTLDVNLIGNYLCTKYVAMEMKKTGGGRIVNIASTNAIDRFSPQAADYDASKAGIVILTKDFAKELASDNILVNAIAPGWADTEMNKDLPANFIVEENEKIYLKRFAKPEEIAMPILFLASSDASYITGAILTVDGGFL